MGFPALEGLVGAPIKRPRVAPGAAVVDVGGRGAATIAFSLERFIRCLKTAKRSGSIFLGRVTRFLRA